MPDTIETIETRSSVCFAYNYPNKKEFSSFWFGSAFSVSKNENDPLTSWPLEPLRDRKNSDFLPFSIESGIKNKKDKVLSDYFFLNTDGFALFFDDLHSWYFRKEIEFDKNGQNKSLLCFSLQPSFPPYGQKNDKDFLHEQITHLDKYLTFKFRILLAKDIRAAHKAAISTFAYLPQPRSKIENKNLFSNSINWDFEDASSLLHLPLKITQI